MFSYLKKLLLFIFFLLVGCEGFIGEDGVVIDSESGKRISNANVILMSEDGIEEERVTDSIGFFDVNKIIGCGLGDCNTDFTIRFNTVGYQTTIINESYAGDEGTEFVTESTKDTLIIKLIPN